MSAIGEITVQKLLSNALLVCYESCLALFCDITVLAYMLHFIEFLAEIAPETVIAIRIVNESARALS